MKFALSFFVLFCLFLSCGNPPQVEDAASQNPSSSIKYGLLNYTFPELSPLAKSQLLNWGVYDDFINEAKKINGSTRDALVDQSALLVSFVDSMQKVIPDTLRTKPMLTRVTVAKTRAYLLQQEVMKSRLDSVGIQNAVKEMTSSVRNLIVQINEKFTKDNIDLEQKDSEANELKKQRRFIDSVYIEELKDKKNGAT